MNNGYFQELALALDNTTVSAADISTCPLYNEGLALLVKAFKRHKTASSRLCFIGNGGSAAIAGHMTADFMKNGGLQTCSLYDSAVMTCIGNDFGYEHIFSKPLSLLCKAGDLLVAISSSGKSPNIVKACATAQEKGLEIVTFTGFEADNDVKRMGNVNVYVPCKEYGKVETIHQLILQQIVDIILEQDGAMVS